MEQCIERIAGTLLQSAQAFLERWQDHRTVNLRDDLAQEATLLALARWPSLRDPQRVTAALRTIARRLRCRAVFRARNIEQQADDLDRCDAPVVTRELRCSPRLLVGGQWVDAQPLLGQLDDVLRSLPSQSRDLLCGYYAGASCRELARRHRLSMDAVKTRLYRGRVRVRREIEKRVSSHQRDGEGLSAVRAGERGEER